MYNAFIPSKRLILTVHVTIDGVKTWLKQKGGTECFMIFNWSLKDVTTN